MVSMNKERDRISLLTKYQMDVHVQRLSITQLCYEGSSSCVGPIESSREIGHLFCVGSCIFSINGIGNFFRQSYKA